MKNSKQITDMETIFAKAKDIFKREIKFRAWEPELNCMFRYNYSMPDLLISFDGKIFQQTFTEDGEPTKELIRDPQPILMQYTGLKDKNDEEIYESDILTWPNAAIPDKEIVFFEDGAFCVRSLDGCKHFLGKDKLNICCEKIGNIYENPDLLEK